MSTQRRVAAGQRPGGNLRVDGPDEPVAQAASSRCPGTRSGSFRAVSGVRGAKGQEVSLAAGENSDETPFLARHAVKIRSEAGSLPEGKVPAADPQTPALLGCAGRTGMPPGAPGAAAGDGGGLEPSGRFVEETQVPLLRPDHRPPRWQGVTRTPRPHRYQLGLAEPGASPWPEAPIRLRRPPRPSANRQGRGAARGHPAPSGFSWGGGSLPRA